MFVCPKCSRILGEVGPDGVLRTVCAGCRYRFQVLQGRLASRTPRRIAVEGPGSRVGVTPRYFELVLDLPGRREPVAIRVGAKAEGITVRAGDLVSVMHSLDGEALSELLVIENHTTAERFAIDPIGTKTRDHAVGLSFLTAAFLYAGLGVGGAPPAVVLTLPFVVLFASWFLFVWLLSPRAKLAAAERHRLASVQSLLERKRALEEQRNAIARDTELRSITATRLLDLKRKMESVGLDAYQPRIALIERALAGMEEQLSLDRQLSDSYARAITMLEIEYESGFAAELDLDPGEEVVARLDELRQLQERHAELARELSANAEVERLLSAGR